MTLHQAINKCSKLTQQAIDQLSNAETMTEQEIESGDFENDLNELREKAECLKILTNGFYDSHQEAL